MIFHTENSIYQVDYEARTVIRFPAGTEMRRDYESVPFLHMDPVSVGEQVSMLLALRDDDVLTYRITTPVIGIEEDDDDES